MFFIARNIIIFYSCDGLSLMVLYNDYHEIRGPVRRLAVRLTYYKFWPYIYNNLEGASW